MPAAGVYLVKFASMAAIPAFFTCSGVWKSGSPAPRSTTSTPARRSRSASAATFSVADVEIPARRSASMSSLLRFCPHAGLHNRRDQPPYLTAEIEHFLDQPRADKRVLLRRHHEHRLERRLEVTVHQRHLKLVLEVRDGPQTADDRAGPLVTRVVDEQPVEGVDLDVGVFAEHVANDLDPFLGREQRVLLSVHENRHDDALEEMHAAENDVHVPVGQRVEGSGKNRQTAARRDTSHDSRFLKCHRRSKVKVKGQKSKVKSKVKGARCTFRFRFRFRFRDAGIFVAAIVNPRVDFTIDLHPTPETYTWNLHPAPLT